MSPETRVLLETAITVALKEVDATGGELKSWNLIVASETHDAKSDTSHVVHFELQSQ